MLYLEKCLQFVSTQLLAQVLGAAAKARVLPQLSSAMQPAVLFEESGTLKQPANWEYQ